MIETTIVNVVATAALHQKIDLYDLKKFREIIHDPEIYGGRVAYFKSSKMKGKVSIFNSGKMISVGTKSEKGATHELQMAKKFLIDKGFVKPTGLECKICNIVATIDFGRRMNLEKLAEKYKIIYEPDQFPGGILRIEEPCKATILIFASGKTVVAGLTSQVQIKRVIQKISNMINSTINSLGGH